MELSDVKREISRLSSKDFEELIVGKDLEQFRKDFIEKLQKHARVLFDKQVYNQQIFNEIVYNEILERLKTKFYHESTPNEFCGKHIFPYLDRYNPSTIKIYFDFLTDKRNKFIDKQIQVFIETYIAVLYNRLDHKKINNGEQELYGETVYLFYKMNGIRIEDAENLYNMAVWSNNLNLSRIEKTLLDMKISAPLWGGNFEEDKLSYQNVLYRFSQDVKGVKTNWFAHKIYYQNTKYNLQVATELAYNTPEISAGLKARFKEIIKKKDFAKYQSLKSNKSKRKTGNKQY